MLRQRARGYIKRREWERVARWEELVHRSEDDLEATHYHALTGIRADIPYVASSTHRWPLAGPAEICAFLRGSRK